MTSRLNMNSFNFRYRDVWDVFWSDLKRLSEFERMDYISL